MLLLLLLAALPTQADPESLLGNYWLPKRDGQIEIYRDGDGYAGRVIAYEKLNQLDVRNADPELRTRLFVGINMLQGFQFDPSDGYWRGGTIYDARSGKTYSAQLWFQDEADSVLWARGFVGSPSFGRTQTFARVGPNETFADVEPASDDAAGDPSRGLVSD